VGLLARTKQSRIVPLQKPVELPASQYFLQYDGTKRKANFVTVFKARRKVIPIESFEQEESGSFLDQDRQRRNYNKALP
jgi:hypothetical protein